MKHKLINGEVSIYARITVNKKVCEVPVKRKITFPNWNFGKGLAKSSNILILTDSNGVNFKQFQGLNLKILNYLHKKLGNHFDRLLNNSK